VQRKPTDFPKVLHRCLVVAFILKIIARDRHDLVDDEAIELALHRH
jgi:hypothetical protein